MDNLTHSLLGAAMARAGLARRHGRGTTALLVIASNLPDVDVALLLTHGREATFLRRMHSHSIVGAPLLALLLALIAWRLSRGRIRLGAAFALSLLGVAGHVALDLSNSYGVVALWPFTHQRFELAWCFIIDLAQWAILLVAVAPRRWIGGPARAERLARVMLAAYGLYVAGCGAARARADALLASELAAESRTPEFRYVFPEALGPHRWRGVTREGDTWRLWSIELAPGRASERESFESAAADPDVAAARATPEGRRIVWFAKAPVWTVDPGRTTATCVDLRFRSLVLPSRRTTFEWRLPLTGSRRPAAAPPRPP